MRKASIPAFLLSFLLPLASMGALSDADRSLITPRNLLSNPGAEFGKSGLTASGGTFTTTSAAANKKSGNAAFSWDSSGAGQTLSFASTTVTSGSGLSADFYGSCYVKCATGTCTHNLEITDGTATTSTAIVSSTTGFVKVSLYHPGSGTMTLRLKSVAADEPILYVDDCRFERADDSQIQRFKEAQFVGSAFFATTSSCSWSRTNTALGAFSTTAACPGPTVEFSEIGSITTTDTDLPKVTFTGLPDGIYEVTVDASVSSTTATNVIAISDGTTTSGRGEAHNADNGTTGTHAVGYFRYTSSGDHTFEIYGAASGSSISLQNESSNRQLRMSVKRFPLGSQLVSGLDQIGTSWHGYHASDCVFARTNTAYGDPAADASCTFTERQNKNFGSVTSYLSGSDKLPGVVFTPKKSGTAYYVCPVAKFEVPTSGAYMDAKLWDGTTVIAENQMRNSGTVTAGSGLPVCGVWTAPSTSPVTLSLQIRGSSGAVEFGANSTSASTIEWAIYDLSSLGQVSFKGVPTSTDDMPRIEYAKIDTSTCAVTLPSGSWLTTPGSHSSTAICTMAITAGLFSTAPLCTATTETQNRVSDINGATTTSFALRTVIGNTNAESAALTNVICVGKR